MDRHRAARIAIVDGHPLVRLGVSRLVEEQDGYALAGTAGTASEALELVRRRTPDVVILGLNVPGAEPLELIGQIGAAREGSRVVVLSGYDDTVMAEPCLRKGALGYVRRDAEPGEVVDALRTILTGEVYVCSRARTDILNRISEGGRVARVSPLSHLTDRELQVFRLLGEGRTTREIAELLELSPKTIQTYRSKIMKKLGIENATRLVHRAVEWSLRQPVLEKGE